MGLCVHRALTVPDIVWEIASKLAEDDNVRGRQRNLFSAALSCKAFQSPCLDILWNMMDTIIPLIRLLPWSQRHDGTIVIRGALNENSFYQYARRVQHLDFTTTTMFEFRAIHSSTFIRFNQMADILLPSLRTLKISFGESSTSSQREKSLLLLPTLIRSPMLNSFTFIGPRDEEEIDDDDEDYNVGALLTALVDLGADIENLNISGSLSSNHSYSLKSLEAVKSLALSLSVGSWTPEVFGLISPFCVLEDLFLDLGAAPLLPSLRQMTNAFPNIRRLSLIGRIPIVLQILVMITGDRLESITLQRDSYDSPTPSLTISQSRLCYQNIGRFSSLRTISVDWRGEDFGASYDHAPVEDMVSILQPLWTFPELESLTLKSIPPCLSLSDATVTAISTAFPRIMVLHLQQTIRPHSILPTFESLARLATNCPKLIKLSLAVDEARSSLPAFDSISYHMLQVLDLLNTIIIRHAQTASYIDRLFPNLQSIDAFHHVDRDLVHDIIFNACRPVRRDQRNRDFLAWGRLHGAAVH